VTAWKRKKEVGRREISVRMKGEWNWLKLVSGHF
jgi:hypothetical protein